MKITKGMAPQTVSLEIGRRIQKYRLDMNMKQSELSERSGVSVATIRRVESGEDVNTSKIIAILLAMDMASNLDYLVPEEIINPIEISNLGHLRKRAAYKRKYTKTIDWGR